MFTLRWLFSPRRTLAGDWAVFGTGKGGRAARARVEALGGRVLFFCDNDTRRQGTELEGLPVRGPEAPGPDQPVAIASGAFPAIARQLLDLGCRNLWFGLESDPCPQVSQLAIDPPLEEMDILAVLPDTLMRRNQVERALVFYRHRFKGARRLALAAPAGLLAAYRTLLPGETFLEYDLEAALAAYHALVIVRHWDAVDDHGWTPLERGILERRIYIMQPWGPIRVTNRMVEPFDFPHTGAHRFLQWAARDPVHFLVDFPYGFICREASNGATDEFGHRIPGDWRALDQRDPGCIVVAMLGGSAVWGAGCVHEECLPTLLESSLLARAGPSGPRFRVLNFGQPGATALDEMIHFLTHVQRIHPDAVIAHDGFNDFHFGQMEDPFLVGSLDLIHCHAFQEWSRIVHGGAVEDVTPRTPSPAALVRAYTRRRAQFAQVVQGFGIPFVAGLQPYIGSKPRHSENEAHYLAHSANANPPGLGNLPLLLGRVQAAPAPPGALCVDFHARFREYGEDADLFQDIVHLTPEGNARVAEAYGELLWNRFGAGWLDRARGNVQGGRP